jgi:hypothetical protein
MLLPKVGFVLAIQFGVFTAEESKLPGATACLGAQELPVPRDNRETREGNASRTGGVGINTVSSELLPVRWGKPPEKVICRVPGTKTAQRKLLPNGVTFARHPEIGTDVTWAGNAQQYT